MTRALGQTAPMCLRSGQEGPATVRLKIPCRRFRISLCESSGRASPHSSPWRNTTPGISPASRFRGSAGAVPFGTHADTVAMQADVPLGFPRACSTIW
jgi:hypothetical protein